MLRRYFHETGPSTEGGKGQDNDKKESDKAEEFPEVHGYFMIYGGQVANASARHRKKEHRELCSVKVAAPVYLDRSDKPITFDQGDHPDCVPSQGSTCSSSTPSSATSGSIRSSWTEVAASTSSTQRPSGSWKSIYPRSGPVRHPFMGSSPGSASCPLDNSICPSASRLPLTSERKPSHSRWSGSEEPCETQNLYIKHY
jgi:hypothetical protein